MVFESLKLVHMFYNPEKCIIFIGETCLKSMTILTLTTHSPNVIFQMEHEWLK